ncbi:HlyD family secretion protein [Parabacteroides acidifaciens]|uniref:HlyD family secretion protein n=1 Tax=Parabacteroides acidifaciens TaxID=2290935 RepID=A0A3D8HDJ0_9BACT|nr:HlyD family secretion protein [Parabacteroides acidifaciens]MBC8602234.1 HlyD family secretion protein [Parabacteroides acidifaciens]RDU49045.1 HlyD family secretion protein [Parabacteroides acidifaciens]
MEVLYEQKTEADKIELYSRENNDILGDAPGWLIHTGSYIIYGLIVLLLVGTALFEYPDVVQSSVVIDDRSNAEWITANSDGLVDRFFVEDRASVKKNDTLGIIQNPASLTDVKRFCQVLTCVEWYYRTNDIRYLKNYPFDLIMGEMSGAYEQFTQAVRTCLAYQELDLYPQRKAFLQEELRLQTELDDKNGLAILQLKRELFELDITHKMEIQKNRRMLELAYENMVNSLKTWESRYMIKSKTDGILLLGKSWSRRTVVHKGDTVCSVVSGSRGKPIGRLFLAESEVGGIEQGDLVQVELAKFPVHTYGYVVGKIASVSYVPYNKSYAVEVAFPDKLVTSVGETIDYETGLSGQAEIIMASKSVLKRIFTPLYEIFKRK